MSNRLKRLRAEGFRSIKDPVEVVFDGRLLLLEGENGAGKTTLGEEALHWLLSGKPLRGESVENIINRDAERAEVSAVFDSAATGEIIVTRTRNSSGSSSFTIKDAEGNDVDLGKGTTAASSADAMQEFLGMPWETLRATAFYAPERGLLGMTDTPRRKLLESAFGLEWVNDAAERAKKAAKHTANVLASAKDSLARAESKAETQRRGAEELQRQAAAARSSSEKDTATRVETLNREIGNALIEKDGLEETIAKVEAQEKELTRQREEVVESRKGAQEKADKLRSLRFQSKARLDAAKAALAPLYRERADLENEDDEHAPACPTCGRPYDTSGKQARYATVIGEIEKHENAAAKESEVLKKLDAALALLDEKLIGPQAASSLRLKEFDGELSTVWQEKARLAASRDALARRVEFDLPGEIARLQAQTRTGGETVRSLEEAHAAAIKDAEEADREVVAYREAVETAERKNAALAWWVRAFGAKGIRSFLLEAKLPELSRLASYYLGQMSDHAMSLEIRPTRLDSKGKEVEAINIIVRNVRGIDSAADGSTGERRIADLALALAQYDLALNRGGRGFGALLLDEALDPLDPERARGVVEVLRDVSRRGLAVVVISHNDDVRGMFERTLAARRGTSGWTEFVENGEPRELPPLQAPDPEGAVTAAPPPLQATVTEGDVIVSRNAPLEAPVAVEGDVDIASLPVVELKKIATAFAKNLGYTRKQKAALCQRINPEKSRPSDLSKKELLAFIEACEEDGCV